MSGPRPGLLRAGSSIALATKTIVLVTGGDAGVGFEIVKSLALLRSDYQILLGCQDTRKGELAAASIGAPININPIQLDITDDLSIEHCFKTIEQMFGRLDILINNASSAGAEIAGAGPGGNPTTREMWTHVVNTNLTSTGVLTERLIPLLEQSKLPRIIFITSALASIQTLLKEGRSADPNIPYYSASKAGINMLVVHYGLQYPHFKVNACCPGMEAGGSNGTAEASQGIDPALGAKNVVRLATEAHGATLTFTNSEGTVPW